MDIYTWIYLTGLNTRYLYLDKSCTWRTLDIYTWIYLTVVNPGAWIYPEPSEPWIYPEPWISIPGYILNLLNSGYLYLDIS